MQDVNFLIPRYILEIPKITIPKLKIYEAYFCLEFGKGKAVSIGDLAKKTNTSMSSVIKALDFFNSHGAEIKCL